MGIALFDQTRQHRGIIQVIRYAQNVNWKINLPTLCQHTVYLYYEMNVVLFVRD